MSPDKGIDWHPRGQCQAVCQWWVSKKAEGWLTEGEKELLAGARNSIGRVSQHSVELVIRIVVVPFCVATFGCHGIDTMN